ncbi:hypothetical protein SDC9_190981 [bioreactor metagenome]|uniref:Uncharacterized protein n=1 Tax=bioreactor metagenome TaxID=1076179 RepID=A0A645HWJ2_9ZZZZ
MVAAVSSTTVAVSGLATGASFTSVVAGIAAVPVTGVVPSVTVTLTAGRFPPPFTQSAPAWVKLTTPVAGSML